MRKVYIVTLVLGIIIFLLSCSDSNYVDSSKSIDSSPSILPTKTQYFFDTNYCEDYYSQHISNDGCAVKYNDSIYFFGDGTPKYSVRITDGEAYLRNPNYKSVYMMKKDGNATKIYSGENISSLRLVENNLNFQDALDPNDMSKKKLIQINLNDLSIRDVTDNYEKTTSFEVIKDGILAIDYSEQENLYSLFFKKGKTNNSQLIEKYIFYPYAFSNKYVVYSTTSTVEVFDLTSKTKKTIFDEKIVNPIGLRIYKKLILFSDNEDKHTYIYDMYKNVLSQINKQNYIFFDENNFFIKRDITTNDSSDYIVSIWRKTNVGEIEFIQGKIDNFSLIDEWLYYAEYAENLLKIMRVKIDGSVIQKLN